MNEIIPKFSSCPDDSEFKIVERPEDEMICRGKISGIVTGFENNIPGLSSENSFVNVEFDFSGNKKEVKKIPLGPNGFGIKSGMKIEFYYVVIK